MTKNIMVIEDDIDIADNLKLLLIEEGYNVTYAPNGKIGFELLERTTNLPDLILLDLMMPIMDGYTFRAHQEFHPTLGKIPVVIMSADGNLETKKSKVTANAFVKKPFQLDIFLATLESFFPQ